jgi:mono/diheme cytochrome c family protein
MNYPFWEPGISYGVLMAFISILHVVISHFAVGGGLYLVLAEIQIRRSGEPEGLEYLKRLSRFFILLTLVTGALTGVGIWFIIGLLSPSATEALIHNFMWGWATEWTFFVVEIAAALVYYYGWERLSQRHHLIIGWIYFGAAFASLFIINGIVSFMLTPGKWLVTGQFWDGFFNPTFWPSLVLRSAVCAMLAGIFALAAIPSSMAEAAKVRLVRFNTFWGMVGLLVALPSLYWYWQAIPSAATRTALLRMPTPIHAVRQSIFFAAIMVIFFLFLLILPRRYHRVMAAILLLAGLGWFGSFEWFRESMRKPYVISGYMYGTGIGVAEASSLQGKGYLQAMAFKTGNDGADLFRRACGSCHTFTGYKPLKPAFDGLDKQFIAGFLAGIQVAKGNMPEFLGTEAERLQLADYLLSQTDRRPVNQIYNLQGIALGKKVFELRCGKCHLFGKHLDNRASFEGMDRESLNELLDLSGNFSPQMPAFSGTPEERKALMEFLLTLNQKGGGQ